MEISQIIPHVESLIFAADRPLPVLDITDLLNNALAFLEDRVTVDQVETAIEAIREKYSTEFYAFEVRESGGGFQFLTKKEYYQTVAQLNGDKFLKRLSTAALETLAIVAYKQPISKGEIEHIRGVSTDYSITKLLEKELIVISGRSETLPGKPLLYSTSKAFMDYFGLNSPKDLPKLKEVFEDEGVQPTLMTGLEENGNGEDADAMSMRVSENGELVEEEILPVIENEVSGQLELPLGQAPEEVAGLEVEEVDEPKAEDEVEGESDESAGQEEPAESPEGEEPAGEIDKNAHPENVIIEHVYIEEIVYVPDPMDEEMENGEVVGEDSEVAEAAGEDGEGFDEDEEDNGEDEDEDLELEDGEDLDEEEEEEDEDEEDEEEEDDEEDEDEEDEDIDEDDEDFDEEDEEDEDEDEDDDFEEDDEEDEDDDEQDENEEDDTRSK